MKYKLADTERVFKDPVCGMEVSYKNAPAVLEHKGKIYCFCAETCRDKFENDPDQYLSKRAKKRTL